MPDMNKCLVGSSEQGYPILSGCHIWHNPKFATAANRKFSKNTQRKEICALIYTVVQHPTIRYCTHTHTQVTAIVIFKFLNCELFTL